MSEDREVVLRLQRESENRGPDAEIDMRLMADKRAEAAWLFYLALQQKGFAEEEALHLVAALGV